MLVVALHSNDCWARKAQETKSFDWCNATILLLKIEPPMPPRRKKVKIEPAVAPTKLLCRVFAGAPGAVQQRYFIAATKKFKQHIAFEYVFIEQIRKEAWSVRQLTDWLKEGHFYAILSHPHQGNEIGSAWDLTTLEDDLERDLANSIGFPMQRGLRCHVLTQVG